MTLYMHGKLATDSESMELIFVQYRPNIQVTIMQHYRIIYEFIIS